MEMDGEFLTQSLAIGRYLGRKFKLTPENELLAYRCDEVLSRYTLCIHLYLYLLCDNLLSFFLSRTYHWKSIVVKQFVD